MSMETHKPHILKGALAGLIGGLIGMAAMSAAEKFFPPQADDRPSPQGFKGQRFALSTRTAEGESLHWALGAVAGAAYGAMAEYYPDVSDKGGAAFGAALCVATHEGILPALGLQQRLGEQASRETGSEMATHLVYGIVTETVRTLVRELI